MFKPVLAVIAVLLVASGICKPHCRRFANEIHPVDVDMDELAKKRLNVVYVEEKKSDHIYIDMVKLADSNYDVTYTIVRNINKTIVVKGKLKYSNGVFDHQFVFPISSGNIRRDITWYVLAKTDEDAMLIYHCDNIDFPDGYRLIIVPSNNTLSATFCRVPTNYILNEESLNQLLSVDRSYNFTENLTMVPYALQDHINDSTLCN